MDFSEHQNIMVKILSELNDTRMNFLNIFTIWHRLFKNYLKYFEYIKVQPLLEISSEECAKFRNN